MHEPLPSGSAVGLVGLGYYTLTVADLCAEAGHPVAFAVDDREGADGDPNGAAYWLAARGIPVLSPADFVERMRSDPVPLVVARVECATDRASADEPLARASDWVRRVSGARPIIHPVSLLEHVPASACPDRYAVFGYPGSGNVLTQNLIDGLFARRATPVPSAWAMRAGLAESYFHGTVARIRAAVAPMNPTHVDFIPHEFGTMMVTVECGADRVGVAFYVPSHRHLGLQRFPTHSRPTRQAVDFFAGVNAPCVVVVRHPLETLLSQANKIARPSRVMFDHPRFLDRAAAVFADWTEHLLANRDRVYVVRYEDAFARRIDAFRRLADWLGVPVTADEAGALFDRYLNRNLPSSVPSHFFRGGSDKWRAEFAPSDLRRVLARVPVEAFTAFGYEVPTEADLSPAPFTGSPKPVSPLHAALLESYLFHKVPGRHGVQVTGTDAAMVAGMTAAFQNPALIALFDAGGLTGNTRPTPAYERAAA